MTLTQELGELIRHSTRNFLFIVPPENGDTNNDKDNAYVMKTDMKTLHEAYQFLVRKHGLKPDAPELVEPIIPQLVLNGEKKSMEEEMKKVDKANEEKEEEVCKL